MFVLVVLIFILHFEQYPKTISSLGDADDDDDDDDIITLQQGAVVFFKKNSSHVFSTSIIRNRRIITGNIEVFTGDLGTIRRRRHIFIEPEPLNRATCK